MTWTSLKGVFNPIFLAAALLGSSPAIAQKVDLSPFLGDVPSVGDTRVYSIDTGDVLVQEVVEVQLTKKAWRVVLRQQQTGQPEVFAESFIVPNKKQLIGDIVSVPLSIDLKKPKKIQKFAYSLGKPQRAKIKGSAFTNFSEPIGPALILTESEFLGFEPIDTPMGSFAQAAHLSNSVALGVSNSLTGDMVSSAIAQDSWIAPLFGPVAIFRASSTYLNDVQQSAKSEILVLQSALINGVAYP